MYFERIKPNYSGYQELHVHTVGSFRDAVNTVSDVFDAAEVLGYNAVAITDHGNWTRLFEALKERTKREKKNLEKALRSHSVPDDEINAVLKTIGPFDSLRNPNDKMKPYIEKYEDAFVEAVKNSIQFVPGIEMYEGDEESPDKYHLILYAKDWIGAKELFKLNNLAQLNKYRELPRTTRTQLKRFFGEGKPGHGHIIMTSACVAGRIPSILLKKFYAQEEINEYRRKLDEKRVYPQYEVDDARARYEDLEADYSAKKEDLTAMKKIANRKFASTLKKAQTAYDNAVKTNSEDLSLRAEELKTIIAQKEETEAVQKLIPGTEKEVAALKDLLKDAKDHLKKLQSANAPADRLEKIIAEMQEQYDAIGDVYQQAKEAALDYERIVGKGNFYIELQKHGIKKEDFVYNDLIRIGRETGIPFTVANDVHYKKKEDKRKRDIIAALRFPNQTIEMIENDEGMGELYFKSYKEMRELFSDIPEALENTSRIAEQCNVFYKKEMHLPQFVDEETHLEPKAYLRKKAFEAVDAKYPDHKEWNAEKRKLFNDRFSYELKIIDQMGFSSYLCLVADFIEYSKKTHGEQSIGPGRGSSAGSLICYLVGITDIDPMRYDLIFERFLNPERVSMPKYIGHSM